MSETKKEAEITKLHDEIVKRHESLTKLLKRYGCDMCQHILKLIEEDTEPNGLKYRTIKRPATEEKVSSKEVQKAAEKVKEDWNKKLKEKYLPRARDVNLVGGLYDALYGDKK